MVRNARFILLAVCLLLCADWTHSADVSRDNAARNEGLLEIECNVAHVDLRLCSKSNFIKKEVKMFFGLIRSHKYVCAGEGLALGATPLKPIPVPTGEYVLLIPTGYVWEHEGPIELSVTPGEKTYFLLKLFSTRSHHPEEDHGGGGGGGGGAASAAP